SEDARYLEESGVSTLAVVKKGSAMNTNHVIRIVTTPALVFILISAAFAGGWAIVTLDDFPEYAVAGKPVNLTFAVRQHGMTLLPGLHPTIRATTATGLTSKANVVPAAGRGQYTAALTLPQQGEWTITIASGFNDSNVPLPAVKVIAPGAPAASPFSPPARGLRLFRSKGCIGCHRHIEVMPVRWFSYSRRLDLPFFVSAFGGSNILIRGTVRMETPVLYFYGSGESSVSVKVSFPHGTITEWYPQASPQRRSNNLIQWQDVKISPEVTPDFPTERGASHYYAARETDAAALQVKSEREKFLFYRLYPPVG